MIKIPEMPSSVYRSIRVDNWRGTVSGYLISVGFTTCKVHGPTNHMSFWTMSDEEYTMFLLKFH